MLKIPRHQFSSCRRNQYCIQHSLHYQIGDQLLEVNGQSFLDVTHDEAVGQLKYHKRMSLVVRDVGKVPHSCTSIEPEPWDAYSPTGTR